MVVLSHCNMLRHIKISIRIKFEMRSLEFLYETDGNSVGGETKPRDTRARKRFITCERWIQCITLSLGLETVSSAPLLTVILIFLKSWRSKT